MNFDLIVCPSVRVRVYACVCKLLEMLDLEDAERVLGVFINVFTEVVAVIAIIESVSLWRR